MTATIVYDSELLPEMTEQLGNYVKEFLKGRGIDAQEIGVGRGDLRPCMGCFGCWVRTPGQCVIQDSVGEINRRCIQSDVVFYLCPVVFGQFSANMKNVIDRWLPNMLPFFEVRDDGSTIHSPRYEHYPQQVMLGFSDDLSEEDGQLFTDITKRHRRSVEVLLYRGDENALGESLQNIPLHRVGGCL